MSSRVRTAGVCWAVLSLGVLIGCNQKPGETGGKSGDPGDLPPREPKVSGNFPELTPKIPAGGGVPTTEPKEKGKGKGKGKGEAKDKDKADSLARLRTVNNLKQIALAMHNFADNGDGKFPAADGNPAAGKDGKAGYAGLSVRVPLLQYITSDKNKAGQEKEIHDKLRDAAAKSDRWNVAELKDVRLEPYSCPVSGKTTEPWHTYYRVFVGSGAAFEAGKRLGLTDFSDGTSNTILVVEAGEAVPWPKPDELAYDPAKPLPKLGGTFPDGFYAAFTDGSVRFIKTGTDEKTIRAMITRNGGEVIADLPPVVDVNALRKAAGIE